MVVPEELAKLAEVPDPVRIKVIDPEAIFLTGFLGESGKKLVAAGVEFYFTRKLANKLIEKKIAIEIKEASAKGELKALKTIVKKFNPYKRQVGDKTFCAGDTLDF